ncbi:adenine nucleotide alpha hydrolases-like protein, partial [Glonium stellatum]
MPGLQVIALISGGKDSLFSILHCLANGHTVVALANLYPPPPPGADPAAPVSETDDLDSYMYQTVGHSLIPLYETALGIPLYRHPIRGRAINTNKTYEPAPAPAPPPTDPSSPAAADPADADADETESLLPLLAHILAHHPTASALSTGAILSTYQRTRIDSISTRLGLVPLAYLWQYPLLPPH